LKSKRKSIRGVNLNIEKENRKRAEIWNIEPGASEDEGL